VVLALLNLSIWPLLSGLSSEFLALDSAHETDSDVAATHDLPKECFWARGDYPAIDFRDFSFPGIKTFTTRVERNSCSVNMELYFGLVRGLGCDRTRQPSRLKRCPWLLPALIFFLFAQGFTGNHSPVLLIRFLPLSASAGLTGRYLIPFRILRRSHSSIWCRCSVFEIRAMGKSGSRFYC